MSGGDNKKKEEKAKPKEEDHKKTDDNINQNKNESKEPKKTNSIADRIKNLTHKNEEKDKSEPNKKEENTKEKATKPKTNLVQERLKMMMAQNDQSKKDRKVSEPIQKKEEKPKEDIRKKSNIEEKIKKLSETTNNQEKKPSEQDNNKKDENFKAKFAERIKQMQSGNINIKEEKKEAPKKLNIEEKMKQLGEHDQPKKEEKKEEEKKEEEKPKKINPFLEFDKQNSAPTIPKSSTSKRNTNILNSSKFGGNFASRMNEMFKKRGTEGNLSHTKTFSKGGPSGIKEETGSQNLDIISEEPDKMKPGYDPSVNLQQKLDSVVVQKNKKKKKKPPTFDG